MPLIARADSAYGVDNFYKITPGVYRGSHPDEKALQKLAQLGIKTIVSLQGEGEGLEKEKTLAKRYGMEVVSVPLTTLDPKPSKEEEKEFGKAAAQEHLRHVALREMRRAAAVMSDSKLQPVYVHCKLGRDRTGIVSGLYLVRYRAERESAPIDKIADEVWKSEVLARGFGKGLGREFFMSLDYLKHLYRANFDPKSAKHLGVPYVVPEESLAIAPHSIDP